MSSMLKKIFSLGGLAPLAAANFGRRRAGCRATPAAVCGEPFVVMAPGSVGYE